MSNVDQSNLIEGAWVDALAEQVGSFQEKGKYLVNICTVACRLKNITFLLN